MKTVPQSVLPILTELRYLLAVGETQPVSNAVPAKRTHLSEGFVKAAVRRLAGEAISYDPQLRTPLHRAPSTPGRQRVLRRQCVAEC